MMSKPEHADSTFKAMSPARMIVVLNVARIVAWLEEIKRVATRRKSGRSPAASTVVKVKYHYSQS